MNRLEALEIILNAVDEWIIGERELYEKHYPDDGYYKTRILKTVEAIEETEKLLRELKENAAE